MLGQATGSHFENQTTKLFMEHKKAQKSLQR